jgi:hypothetical protein
MGSGSLAPLEQTTHATKAKETTRRWVNLMRKPLGIE